MKRRRSAMILLLLIFLVMPTSLTAQGNGTGFVAAYLRDLSDVKTKLVSLAEAIPESKYDWRPAAGVRSVGEVYVHVGEANGFMPNFLGQPSSSTIASSPRTKAQIIAALDASFVALRKAAEATPESALESKVDFFGQNMTERAFLMANLAHLHEHLGQSIAYARVNGVVPPWSR